MKEIWQENLAQENRIRLYSEFEHEQWDLVVDDLYSLITDKALMSPDGKGWSDQMFQYLMDAFSKLIHHNSSYLGDILLLINLKGEGISKEQYHILLSIIEKNFGYIVHDQARFSVAEWLGGCKDTRSLFIIEKWLYAQPTEKVKRSLFIALFHYIVINPQYVEEANNKAKALRLLHEFFGFDVDEKGKLVKSQSV